ncbi:hypothetical protein SeLEV6574_g04252 [Synchytrium endobioticum]|nr:hypothetical protein SeLEV6574_g04252 [Synchytrium endobioticum]
MGPVSEPHHITTSSPYPATMLANPRKILIGVDESEQGTAALNYAICEVAKDNDQIIVLNARSKPSMLASKDSKEQHELNEIATGKQSLVPILHDAVARSGKNLTLLVDIECGDPRETLMSAIENFHPFLVVVGDRGMSALKAMIVGSTTNYLVHNSPVPVLVVRHSLGKPAQLLGHAKRDTGDTGTSTVSSVASAETARYTVPSGTAITTITPGTTASTVSGVPPGGIARSS